MSSQTHFTREALIERIAVQIALAERKSLGIGSDRAYILAVYADATRVVDGGGAEPFAVT